MTPEAKLEAYEAFLREVVATDIAECYTVAGRSVMLGELADQARGLLGLEVVGGPVYLEWVGDTPAHDAREGHRAARRPGSMVGAPAGVTLEAERDSEEE